MMPSHKIKNAVFDLRFRSKAALLQENASLGEFVKKSLMPAVDEVLSEHDLEDHVIHIDKIKIDLGSFQRVDFKHQMKSRLRIKLDSLLKSKIRNLPTASDAQERIIPLTKRNLELIEHFLMIGTLPGSLSPKQDWIPDRQLQLVLKQEQSNFLKFLQKTVHRPQVIQRLVRQFSAGTVRQVVRLLAPTQSETALQAVADILRRYPGRSSAGMQTAAFTAPVWELLLTYLLQNPESRFTAVQFTNWIKKKADSREIPATDSLATALAAAGQGSAPPEKLLHQPEHLPQDSVSKNEMRRILKGFDLYEALRFYRQHGMIPWTAGILSPDISVTEIIDELAGSYPEKLLKFAKELQYGPGLCQRPAEKLTPAVMKKFIAALARLAGFPSLQSRVIEALEALPAEAEEVLDKKILLQLRESLAADRQQGNLEFATDKPTREDASALIKYLIGDPSSRLVSDTTASLLFRRMVRHGSDTLVASLRDHLRDQTVRKKIIALLPENWLTRVLAGLRPDLHLPVQTYAEIIADACYSEEIAARPEEISRLKWEFIFAYLAQSGNRRFQASNFIQRFIDFLSAKIPQMDKAALSAVLSQNLKADLKSSTRSTHLTVLKELGETENASEDLKLIHPAGLWKTVEDMPEGVVVQNAGMLIAAPYLPQLWNMLELIEGGQFKYVQAAERAVHLLQFMTDESTESPEYELVLNKILCGIETDMPIGQRIDITGKEREAVEGLIRGMIENWKTIGQTSVQGFRESFLQRRGSLALKDDAWHLKVEQRTFDMLLDSIPWGFATIKHRWMERVVYVKWR
jgi:hypothetical protein